LPIALLDGLPDAAQLRGDFPSTALSESGASGLMVGLACANTENPGPRRVQQALSTISRAGAATRRLDLDPREAQPSFDHVRSQLDVRIRE
jgi:hypothetical protein